MSLSCNINIIASVFETNAKSLPYPANMRRWRNVGLLLATVYDVGLTVNQRWANVSCSMGILSMIEHTSKHKTFVQRRNNVFVVGPTLHKCFTNVLSLLGIAPLVLQTVQNHVVYIILDTDRSAVRHFEGDFLLPFHIHDTTETQRVERAVKLHCYKII